MEPDNNTMDYFSDNTTSGLEEALGHIHTFSMVMYCLIIVVGTVGNGLVIYVTGFKMKTTVNSVWFLNLAIADFLFTTFLIFTTISLSQDHQWPFGDVMCKLNTFVGVVNMFASIFLLTAISLDRCLSIWVVVWAQNKRTVLKAQILCAVIWVTAGVCSTPYATFRTVIEENGENTCGYSSISTETVWSLAIFRFVVGFLVPFLVIFFSYLAIVIRARRLQRTKKQRSHRIIFSIILAFFICWLPFHVIHFIELKAKDNQDLRDIVKIGGPLTVILAFMNSCLNPILYVFMCEEFQKKTRQSICLVLETALAEDNVSLAFPRSLKSHFLQTQQKCDSVAPLDGKHAVTSPTFTNSKVVCFEKTESTGEDVRNDSTI